MNIISESSREILNDNFADSNGSCRIKNVTERLKFGEMQVDDILITFKAECLKYIYIYQSDKSSFK